jgi:bifunctional DNA-binding transcriptional regulator/antitoxin component of YhaV-PrlF toxin-antitoxin module
MCYNGFNMTYTVSITSQGQISIPIQLRRKLGLDKSKKALIREENGELVVKPVKDFLELGGSLKEYAKGKKPLSNKELDEVIAQAVADDYIEKLQRNQ